jgi:hypothetical protein
METCVPICLPQELNAKSFTDFYVPGDIVEKQKLRFHHFEV